MKYLTNKLFRVCPKTGKIRGLNKKFIVYKLLFPIFGLISLIWVLIRVIPKPSRATYPCQTVAIPFANAFLCYLTAILLSVTTFKSTQHFLRNRKFVLSAFIVIIGISLSLLFYVKSSENAIAQDTGTFTPSDAPNSPIGVARGINPGRVAWSYDLSACNWNGSSNYWWSTANNDQTKITTLLNNIVCSVAGQTTVQASWDALFKFKNNGTAYAKGEKIFIKLNLNNNGNSNAIDASPQSVYALLDQLVNKFGANQADIIVADPARENQGSAVKNYCISAFPNVIYNTNLGGWTTCLQLNNAQATERSISTALYNAKYLITMALLKRHCTPSATWGTDGNDYGNASVTMILKSSWGLVGNGRANMHGLLQDWNYPMNSYNVLTDIYGSKHINGKTVLCILDGLYTGDRWNSQPRKWNMAPFNGKWPSSMFASQDPIAIESVGLDFLRSEMSLVKNADHHLHEAAQANNPPSGTEYKPDGTRIGSLGVHEHWNNTTNKQYSRNLGTGLGIELVNIPTGVVNVAVTGVSVNPTTSSITVNGTSQLTANVLPTNATNKNVTWTSSNATIATVSSTGLVTGKTAGNASITVTTQDQGKTASCAITITVNNSGITSGGTYELIARHSGKVIGIKRASTANSALAVQQTYSGVPSQQFIVTDLGNGYYRISPTSNTNQALDVTGASTADGASINQWPFGNATNQQWQLVATGNYYNIISRSSGKCMDITGASTADSAAIIQWPCGTGTNQQFSFTRLKSELIQEPELIDDNTVIFPNPSNGLFYINGVKQGILTIYTTNGKLLLTKNIENKTEVNSGLLPGIYLLKISIDGKIKTKKLIIR